MTGASASSPRLFAKTSILIKDHYYDPTRVKPKEMLLGALKAIGTVSPSVHVEGTSSSGTLTVRVGTEAKDFDLAAVISLWTMLFRFQEIFAFLAAEPSTASELAQIEFAAVNGMLSTLDERSLLLTRKTAQRMRSATGTVHTRLLSPDVGYVRLTSFPSTAALDLRVALRNLSEEARSGGGLKGLVLDLRGNPGGLLEQAIEVADQFLSDGVIVNLANMRGVQEARRARQDASDSAYPLVVLVDGETAVGAELVVAALKDRERAVIIGRRTLGVGLIQVIYQYGDSEPSLRLTVAEIFTPSGAAIHGVGVEPDISLIRMAPLAAGSPSEEDPALNPFAAPRVTRSTEHASLELRYHWNDHEDFELLFARDLLTRAPYAQRSKMLSAAAALVAERQGPEKEKIRAQGRTVELQ